ncbi:MAG: hypothetical protein ABL872_05640 [Lacibacter sp.]
MAQAVVINHFLQLPDDFLLANNVAELHAAKIGFGGNKKAEVITSAFL